MTKPTTLINSFLYILFPLSAQILEGTVEDIHHQPLQEANVFNINSDLHTHTNEEGQFSLENVSLGDTLQIIFLGYETRQLEVRDINKPFMITLKEKVINLEEITILRKIDALHIFTDIDLQTKPVASSQDILQKVPGLFIGQHAGGGKAEQIFLRGFDIDHGTDINITVDGLPVNMVSHAHGQGYADLHFVIPETIEKINFGKGPYDQDKGNFTTAGYVDFMTKQLLERSAIQLEAGQFDTYRLLGLFDLLATNKHKAYIATEYLSTNGYFDSPQNFNRINLFGKYTGQINQHDKLSITASYFDSQWDASGQVPQRAIDSGLISRFGAIDDTEGGTTSRTNISLSYHKSIDKHSYIHNTVYLCQYDFELYSNFTFFLEDSINGDQLKQKEKRTIYGASSEYNSLFSKGKFEGSWQAGVSIRNDQSQNNELSHTLNRYELISQIQLGDINETNLGAYLGTHINSNDWTFNPSVRVDYFNFKYMDRLLTNYKTQEEGETIVSPKLNILYNPTSVLQLYLKMGKGFHSNDTRVVVAQKGNTILPDAYGADVGFIWKPNPKMLLNMAYWYLYLEQEFVYVGDAGIVEPSGKTRRQGVDLNYRYQAFQWLFWNLDLNYTYARSIDEPNEANYIPLAPAFTLVGGLNFLFQSGLYGSVNARHIADRPANEDNSIVATGYTISDLNVGYTWQNMDFSLQIQNLFNTEWNETQFATESRLQDEIEAVEEIHFTPGTPFFLKALVKYEF